MFRKFLSLAFVIVIVCSGLSIPNPAVAQDATPITDQATTEGTAIVTPTPAPSATATPGEATISTAVPDSPATPTAPPITDPSIEGAPTTGPPQTMRLTSFLLAASNDEIELTINGSHDPYTAAFPAIFNINATGPWNAANAPVFYEVHHDDCEGDTYRPPLQMIAAADGTAMQHSQDISIGSYGILVTYGDLESNCLLLTVTPPNVDLYANGSIDDLAILLLDSVQFRVYSDLFEGSINATARYDLRQGGCDGTSIGGGFADKQTGFAQFTLSGTGQGTFGVVSFVSGDLGPEYRSNCITLTVSGFAVALTVNGSSDTPQELEIGSTVALHATGPWNAGAVNVILNDDFTCPGEDMVFHQSQFSSVTNYAANMSLTANDLCEHRYSVLWVVPADGSYRSDNIFVQFTEPDIALTVGGSTADISIGTGIPITFRATGPWSAHADGMYYTSEYFTCNGEPDHHSGATPVDPNAVTTAGQYDFTFSENDACDVDFTFSWVIGGQTFTSNPVHVSFVAPSVSLAVNGSEQDQTLPAHVPMDFAITGPWPADTTGIALWQIITCDGGEGVKEGQVFSPGINPVENGIVRTQRTESDLCSFEYYARWAVGDNVYESGRVKVTLEAPIVSLAVNGGEQDQTLPANSQIDFAITGPWPANTTGIALWQIKTCDGEAEVKEGQVFSPGTNPVENGIVHTQRTESDLCSFEYYAVWAVGEEVYESNHVTVTLVAPTITITANSQQGNLTVNTGQTVTVKATGNWSQNETGLSYKIGLSDETCSPEADATTIAPSGPGALQFTWTPTSAGRFAVQMYWEIGDNQVASNCVLVQVMAATQPSPTTSPSATVTTSPTPGPSPTASPTATPSPTTIPTPDPSSTATSSSTATVEQSPTSDPAVTQTPTATSTTTVPPTQTPTIGTTLIVTITFSNGASIEGAPYDLYAAQASIAFHTEPYRSGEVSANNTILITDLLPGTYKLVISPVGMTPIVAIVEVGDPPLTEVHLSVQADGSVTVPTTTTTPSPEATNDAVSDLPSTGNSPGSRSMWLGSAATLAIAMTAAGAFVYRTNRLRP